MKNVLFALCIIGVGLVACNRGEGVDTNPPKADGGGGGGKKFLPPTDYRLPVPPAPECGGLGQLCCSDGDGVVCHDGLVCVGGQTCQDPNGGGDMTTVADAGTPDMGAGDGGGSDSGLGGDMAGSGGDLSGGPVDLGSPPDMSEPDNETCECDKPAHGKGLGHCQEKHHPNYNGHGWGHCKYDCE